MKRHMTLCDQCGKEVSKLKYANNGGICDACVHYLDRLEKVRQCPVCGEYFIPNTESHTYCSHKCSKKHVKDKSIKIRFIILERDNFRCIYCGKSSIEDAKELQIDHIIPVSAGGSSRADNLVTACIACNQMKEAKILNNHNLNRVQDEVKKRNKACGISNDAIIRIYSYMQSVEDKSDDE